MTEQEFRDLLDDYSTESGFDFHVVQKRWAYLAAKELSKHENEAKDKQIAELKEQSLIMEVEILRYKKALKE